MEEFETGDFEDFGSWGRLDTKPGSTLDEVVLEVSSFMFYKDLGYYLVFAHNNLLFTVYKNQVWPI